MKKLLPFKKDLMEKKTKIIVLLVFVTLVVITVLGVSLGLTLKLSSPKPEVVEVVGEPDYTIKIEWKKVIGAKQYIIKYRYRDVYGEKYAFVTTDDNFVVIKRVKGNLDFSVQALNGREIQTSNFSNERTYVVEGLKLPALKSFGFTELPSFSAKINQDFEPVTYIYKGAEKEVEFYEFSDNHNPGDVVVLSYAELVEYVFNFPPGETYAKFRPVIYATIGDTIVDGPIELKELYENPTTYVVVRHYNPE